MWLTLGGPVFAQSLLPLDARRGAMIEGSSGLPPAYHPPLIGEAPRQHLGPTGRPCIAVTGVAQPEVANTNVFQHIISANNACSQVINLQVCYYRTEHCVPLRVPSYARDNVVLGVMPAMKEFRFEYREQFP
jgi:hypothetical protein